MNAGEMLEHACSDAWPPLRQERLGDWRLRWAAGFTGRANSALAAGNPGVAIPEALRTVCDFAHSSDITAAVQAIHGSPVEAKIAAAGWVENVAHPGGHEVSVLLGELDGDVANVTAVRPTILAAPTPGWWELTAGTREPNEAQRHVLTSGTVGFGVAEADGTTAAAVRVAIVGELMHVARLAVRPGYRRRRVASALMDTAAAWARKRGVRRTVLQVSVTNAPALALYRELGFAEHHRYRYWVPPPATCEDRKS